MIPATDKLIVQHPAITVNRRIAWCWTWTWQRRPPTWSADGRYLQMRTILHWRRLRRWHVTHATKVTTDTNDIWVTGRPIFISSWLPLSSPHQHHGLTPVTLSLLRLIVSTSLAVNAWRTMVILINNNTVYNIIDTYVFLPFLCRFSLGGLLSSVPEEHETAVRLPVCLPVPACLPTPHPPAYPFLRLPGGNRLHVAAPSFDFRTPSTFPPRTRRGIN